MVDKEKVRQEAQTVNAYAVTKAIPFDELMTAVDVAEDKLLSGQYSKARFNKGELYFEVKEHWIRTRPMVDTIPITIESPPQIARHKIKWSMPNLKVEYRYLDIRLKEFIVLTKPMPVAFYYELDEGSYLQGNPDGSISMWGEGGTEIVTIEKPYATDREGKKFELRYELNGSRLELAGDLSGAVYPLTIDPTYTVKTGTLYDSTCWNFCRHLARKSTGDLWCTYYRSDGTTNQIYCAYSVDGGQNWTEEQITNQTGTNHQRYPSIAIDSQDYIHLAWGGKGWGTNTTKFNIQYCKRTTSWQTQEAVTDVAGHQFTVSIAIDSSDNVHVAFYGLGWGINTAKTNIQYRKRTTSWQTQEAVTDVAYTQEYPIIAIDSQDYIHVIWHGLGWGTNTTEDNIQYRKRTDSWQTQEAVTDVAYTQEYPSIAIDSQDYIHVAWDGLGWGTNTGYVNIQYRKRTTSWQTQEAVTDKDNWQFNVSIAIDSSDYVHVVWEGYGWGTNTTNDNIQYRKRTDSWQTQEAVTDVAYDQGFPVLIWALHPTVSTLKTNRPKTGYALVWSGQDASGYKVEYFCSTDLSWDASGWKGKIGGVTDPGKVKGVPAANIAKVKGVS